MLTGAKQPQTVIYGEAWVGGVVVYNNQRHTPGSKDNYEVYLGLAHCCHEVDSITDLYFGNDLLVDGVDIDWTAGSVTAGKYGISKSGVYAVDVERQFGTVGQAAPALLTAAFPFDWTSAHTMPGVCSTFYKFTYFSKTATAPEDLFYAGPPQTIRVKIKGRKIYDPRLDSTNGGSGGQRPALESSWTWSDNPILCWVDYMRNYKDIAFAKIDWDWVRTQADVCDVSCSGASGPGAEALYLQRCDLARHDAREDPRSDSVFVYGELPEGVRDSGVRLQVPIPRRVPFSTRATWSEL